MSAAFMIPCSELAPLVHGGDLDAARRLFPGAPEPFLDLSTGINPHPYPIPHLPPAVFTKLPEPAARLRLAGLAAAAYGAPSEDHVAVGPGTQVLMALAAYMVPPGRAGILAPTYAEHARVARLAGHHSEEVSDLGRLREMDLAVVVNPNNPDGRLAAKDDLLATAERLARRDGLLVVDEAFMDVGPDGTSLADESRCGNIVVLRSVGKFFGLPGLRLGFAVASPDLVARLAAGLGPWPVSGAALVAGSAALADTAWRETARQSLTKSAARLDDMLTAAGLQIIGGTSLFRLVRSTHTEALFHRLGQAGIVVRRFPEASDHLRFGLPGAEAEWQRLSAVLGL